MNKHFRTLTLTSPEHKFKYWVGAKTETEVDRLVQSFLEQVKPFLDAGGYKTQVDYAQYSMGRAGSEDFAHIGNGTFHVSGPEMSALVNDPQMWEAINAGMITTDEDVNRKVQFFEELTEWEKTNL